MVGVFILGPIVALNSIIFQILQYRSSKLAALSNDLSTSVILHTIRYFIFRQGKKFVHENIFQVVVLCFILFINLSKRQLILLFRLAGFDGTGEQFLINHDTAQRRIGLQ